MRKAFLLIVLLFVCLTIISCPDINNDPVIDNNLPDNQIKEPEKQVLYDETIKVNAGSYVKYGFLLYSNTNVRIEVKSELDFNVWLILADEIDDFERNETFEYNANASRQKITSFSTDVVLGLGWHYIVLDNKYAWFTAKNISIKVVVG